MIIDYKKNKRADIAVVILVFLTLILYSSALYVFNINSNKVSSEIISVKILDSIYVNEVQINFYVNEAMEKASKESNSKEEFISNFNKEIERYIGVLDEELITKIKQFSSESRVEDNEIVFNVQLRIDKDYKDKIKISYSYSEEFRSVI